MLNATFHALGAWPAKRTQTRERSPFKGTYQKTLALLERELGHLRAENIRVYIDVDPSDIRLDGWPRGSARPKMPGVVLAYKSRGAEFSMPCDTFTDWQTNLRAIAMTLERLRAIDRYGVTQGQQYSGFKALTAAPQQMSTDQAASIIAGIVEGSAALILSSPDHYKDAYRKCAMKLHPDHGGKPEDWNLFQQAALLLQKHHGGARG